MGRVTRSMQATAAAEAAEVDRERRTLSSGAWGVLLLIAAELTLFASLIATYFYLRFKDPTWPPAGVPKPEVALPLVFTGILVASVDPDGGRRRGGEGRAREARLAPARERPPRSRRPTWACRSTSSSATSTSSRPLETAYGSIYFVLLGLHHAHVAVGLALDAFLLTRLAGRPHQLPAARAPRDLLLLVLRRRDRDPRRPHPALSVAMRVPLADIRIDQPTSPISPLLWFAVLGAPAAWALQFGISYWLTEAECSPAGAMWGISLDAWIIVLSAIAIPDRARRRAAPLGLFARRMAPARNRPGAGTGSSPLSG